MRPPPARDEQWFTALYAAHHPQVVRYGLRRLADPEAAVDLAQEVFTIAWRRRTEVSDVALPWLYGTARRVLANQWRARRNGPAVVATDPHLLPDGPGVTGPDAGVGVTALRATLATLS